MQSGTVTEGSVLTSCRNARCLPWLSLLFGHFSKKWTQRALKNLQWCVLLWRRFFGKKWFLTYHFIFKFLFQKIVEALAKKKKKKEARCTPVAHLSIWTQSFPSSAPDAVWSTGIKLSQCGSTLYWLENVKHSTMSMPWVISGNPRVWIDWKMTVKS